MNRLTDIYLGSTHSYILKDNLGSWTTITDSVGTVEQEVNMNGRMYDPQMSSFLSVDAYVQSPDNSQNFNRYAYCLNTPLKYTDPSGWQLIGGMTPGNPFHENWGVNFAQKVVTAHEAREILRDMGIPAVIWKAGNEMVGGGGASNDGGDDDKYCFFGNRDPNSVGVTGPGACVFASMGLICNRLNCWNMDSKYWKAKEEEYYKMKNADGEENNSNHGYLSTNLVEFVQWVGNQENITIIIQQIVLKDIPKVSDDNGEVLVIVSLDNSALIEKNNAQTGHAAVVNTFLWRKNDSIEMTFGDPSPIRIMPLIYRDNNSFGWRPEGFSAWGFYGINIIKP